MAKSISGCTFFLRIEECTRKRLADRKIEKFDKNITTRGFVPETTTKKGKDYPVGPILLGFFLSSRSSGLQLAEAWRKPNHHSS
ncbi:hypothetical protein YC2023_083435 [Brassica napus]